MPQNQSVFRLTALVLQFLTLALCAAQYASPASKISPLYSREKRMSIPEFHNAAGTPGDQANTNQSCSRSRTLYNGQYPCTGQLLFEDHFNRLDKKQWRALKEFSGIPDAEFVMYQDDDAHVSVKDGELRIKPTLLGRQYSTQFIRYGTLIIDGCTGRIGTAECERIGRGFHILPPVASGMIDTKRSFNFLFGRVEIRAKLPRGDWIYPVIMLKPMDAAYGAGYKSGELRIASAAGNRDLQTITGENFDGHVLRGGAVVSPEGPIRQDTMSKKISNNYWSDDYHIYELEWTPTSISVKVDGEKYGEKEYPATPHRKEIFKDSTDRWTGQNAPFDKPFYLSFGVAVGGHGEFPDSCVSGGHAKPWRNFESKGLLNFFTATDTWASTWTEKESTLEVDYIKVWAL